MAKKRSVLAEMERVIKAETKKVRQWEREQYKKALAEYRAAYKIFSGQ